MRFEESKYQKRGIGQVRGQGIYVKQQAIPKPAFWKQRLDNIGRLPPQEANLQGKFAFKPGPMRTGIPDRISAKEYKDGILKAI